MYYIQIVHSILLESAELFLVLSHSWWIVVVLNTASYHSDTPSVKPTKDVICNQLTTPSPKKGKGIKIVGSDGVVMGIPDRRQIRALHDVLATKDLEPLAVRFLN